jgi:tetratricopeptide (TPR) repeat protein
LFDDQLRLVGILTFRLRGGAAHYFAMPIEWLAAELDNATHDLPVGPPEPVALAFWEQPVQAQPLFLRAASLERAGDWAALQPLAAAWARGALDDPEPWYLLGVALDAQSRPDEARNALECSLVIAPDFAPARARLAPIYRREGLTASLAPPSTPCQL